MINQSAPSLNGYWTVSQLNAAIRGLVEEGFPYVRVTGEVSNLKKPGSGHLYFTLGDDASQIRAIIWRTTLPRLSPPEEGQAILATGRIAVYEARGEYQLVVEGIKPAGAGVGRELLRQRYQKLAAQGLFDPDNKKPLPPFPRVIGVVTSRTGAALQDILRILEEGGLGFHLLVAHARVQGEGAAAEIARALDRLNEDGRAEVILCGRGGGSAEDLSAFNEEEVVWAIARSRAPVISAVGHEIDLTLSDLVADARAPTPTAAAQMALPARQELESRLHGAVHRLGLAMANLLTRQRARIHHLAARLTGPRARIDHARLRADDLGERLLRAMALLLLRRQTRLEGATRRLLAWPRGSALATRDHQWRHLTTRLHAAAPRLLTGQRVRLDTLEQRLRALSPLAVLARGYAIVLTPRGRAARSSRDVAPGDTLSVRLHRGSLDVAVLARHPTRKPPLS